MKAESMQQSNSDAQKIYDIGMGVQRLLAVIFISIAVIMIGSLGVRWRELAAIPRIVRVNPIYGIVLILGGLIALWCVGWLIWAPLRNAFFFSTVNGRFGGFSVKIRPQGQAFVYLDVGQKTYACAYNELLEERLRTLSPGDNIMLRTGTRGLILRIEKL